MIAFPTARIPVHLPVLALLVAAMGALAQNASAQAVRTEPNVRSGPILARATAENPEVVRHLTGLAKIESDRQPGLPFLKDGLARPEGSHFGHARAGTNPEIRDGLVAAGVTDFETLLVASEARGDERTVMAAYTGAIAALMQARSVMRPFAEDKLLSIMLQARAVADEINPTGPTEVQNFRDASALRMVARNEIDLLFRSEEAAIAKAAKEMALAFDDVILSMPDPNAAGPVSFDPAPILAAIGVLEGLAGSV